MECGGGCPEVISAPSLRSFGLDYKDECKKMMDEQKHYEKLQLMCGATIKTPEQATYTSASSIRR